MYISLTIIEAGLGMYISLTIIEAGHLNLLSKLKTLKF
jgi:hypothetical protein